MSYPKLIYDVKSNINIVDVISLKVQLKRSGQNFVGCCPFHNEKTPSFTVSPTKKIYTCFGCGESGDVINFVEKTENLIFHDTILKLAHQANLNVDDYLDAAHQDSDSEDYKNRQSILIALKKAQDFYVQNLAEEHYQYFAKRGIGADTVERFGIGYAPKNNILLKSFQGFSNEILLASGLISKNENQNHYYDFFYDSRIVFPIYEKSSVVSFAGRTLSETVKPKYTNFRNTIVSEKSNNLFGLHLALSHIIQSKTAYVVEGYTDVMMMHQEGILNSIAKCGTSFTKAHANKLLKIAKRIVFVPDSDIWTDAMKFKTFEKEVNIALEKGFEILVVKLDNGHDPCSLQHNVKDAFQVKHDAIEFLAKHYFETAESVSEKGEAVEKVAELIAKTKSTSQEFYISEIAKNQKITKTSLKKAVKECIPQSKSDNDSKQDDETDLYHIKVRDTFFELTIEETANGAINEIYVPRKRSELEKELGDLNGIPRFSGIRVEPSHTNFRYTFSQSHKSKRTRGQARDYKFVNWYNPLPYDCKKFDILDEAEVQAKIGNILGFFKHIFRDKVVLGLDYVTIMYQFPKRKLPALALVSRNRKTGKSTFMDLMKEFFGANATMSSLQRLMGNFNKLIQGKLLCCVEETRDERGEGENKLKDMITNPTTIIEGKGSDSFTANQYVKLMLSSNFPNSFLKITDNEDRFIVLEVQRVEKMDNKLLSKMIAELSYFRYFLENREIVHEDKSRLWFDFKLYDTQALRNVKEASKNPTLAAIEDLIRKIFLLKLRDEDELFRSFKICSKILSDYMNHYYDTKKYNKIWLTKTLKAHDIISSKNSTRFTYPQINFGGEIVEWKRTNARWYEFEITDYLNREEIVELYEKEELKKLFTKEEIQSRNLRSKGIKGDDGDDCPF